MTNKKTVEVTRNYFGGLCRNHYKNVKRGAMADRKTDRRTIKTRRAIFDGLAALLTEKELGSITVQELSDKADVHRVTFYKHFMDIYDVYEQLEKLILSEIGLLLTEFGEKTASEVYPSVFKYIRENPGYFKMILSPHNTSTLYQKLLKMVEGLNRVIWSESVGFDMNDGRAECVIRYHSNGCLAILAGWVEGNFSLPEEFISKTLSELDQSTKNYLTSLFAK